MLRRPSHGPIAGGAGTRGPDDFTEYVRPYVKAQKNDDRDAEAIPEAATRPIMRFVELKSEEQLETPHRVRDRLVGERTSLTNQIRSLLLERGHMVAQGHARLRFGLGELLDSGADVLSPRMAFLVGDTGTRWEELDRRIAAFDAEFAAMARTDDRARRCGLCAAYCVPNRRLRPLGIGAPRPAAAPVLTNRRRGPAH
jgi:transposase